MVKTSLAPIMFILASVAAAGQNVGTVAARSYASTKELAAQLESKDLDVRKSVVDSLGLLDPMPVNGPGGVGGIYNPCYEEFDKVEIKPATLVRDKESAILVVESDSCQSIFIIPVIKERDTWNAYKAISIWTKFNHPFIRIDSLVRTGEQEIIVSDVIVDEGTGFFQKNMTIFKFLRGKLEVVFDQPESIQVAVPSEDKGTAISYENHETSTFKFSKCDENMTGLMYIGEIRNILVEKRSAKVNEHFHTKRSLNVHRSFIWNPRLEIFRMIEQAE